MVIKQTTRIIIGASPKTKTFKHFDSCSIISMASLLVASVHTMRVVGTPLGLTDFMSEGIVNALNRKLTTGEYSITNVIQIMAPINPGNSGGPLLNYQGRVVEIVTAIIQDF